MANTGRRLFTSEAVCMGHPDKVADQISDGILDELLRQDPTSRVACETLLKNGLAIVAGEITTRGYVEIPTLVKKVIEEIGYTDPASSFNCHSVGVLTCLEPQSPDISQGVNEDPAKAKDLGAGDQGMMFGYACRETPELMPLPIGLARKLVNRAAEVRMKGVLKYLRPDGKSQVTVEYDGDKPARIHTVVLSLQHAPEVSLEQMKTDFRTHIIDPVLPPGMVDANLKLHINPTGRFVQGGPQADCGLTGRKIIVDTYGGMGHHGGGCFSGKDPTKVDRSACYYARYAAKNIVAAGLADRCELQVAYAIGVARPVSVLVETYGTGRVPNSRILELVEKHFDFRPRAIIDQLDLRRPIYKQTARFGHFGTDDPNYTWERTDKAETLRSEAGLAVPAAQPVGAR
ncbi:MAG: methionine adenosyltransferase [Planctomycetes bacterium]|nr:methionine adenosyltransferase [Planctomycetota bacterium]